MQLDDRRISVSLATVEFKPASGGTNRFHRAGRLPRRSRFARTGGGDREPARCTGRRAASGGSMSLAAPTGLPRHEHRRPHPLARPARPLPGRPDDRPRRHDRRRGAAVDQDRPRLLGEPLAWVERLPDRLRRFPPARREAGRPLWPPALVPDRYQPVHRRLARMRARNHAGDVGGSAGGPGTRRRNRLSRCSLADDDALHRAGRAGEGNGYLRLRRLAEARLACCSGNSHRRSRLALDLPRQRPDRRRRRRALAQADPRGARRRLWPSASTSPARSP